MDLRCHKCGSPWDMDEVLDWERYFRRDSENNLRTAKDFHNGVGCPSCDWGKNAPEKPPFAAMLASALTDVLGNDTDGIAGELDDYDSLFGFEGE
jgi:hypothetical protein